MVVAVVEMRNILLLCTRGYICWRLWFPRDVRMVSPIGIICVAVWGIGWWLVLAHNIGLFSHHVPH